MNENDILFDDGRLRIEVQGMRATEEVRISISTESDAMFMCIDLPPDVAKSVADRLHLLADAIMKRRALGEANQA